MKAKDIIQEGLFGDLSRAASDAVDTIYRKKYSSPGAGIGGKIKSFFDPSRKKYNRSTKDQMAASKFIDKFVNRGLEVLNVAVDQGLADPNSNVLSQVKQTTKKKQSTTKSTKKQPQQTQPTTAQPQPTQPTTAQPQSAPQQQSNIVIPQTYRTKQTPGPNQIAPAAAKTPAQVRQQKQGAAAKTVQAQMTAKPAVAQAAPKAKAKSVKPATSTKTQKPETVKIGGQKISPKDPLYGKIMKGVKEDRSYEKLNVIFESYIQLLEQQTAPPNNPQPNVAQPAAAPKVAPKVAQPKAKTNTKTKSNTKAKTPATQQAALPSISAYFKENFLDGFLAGINMKPAQPKIDALLKDLPTLYKSGKLKAALEDLANVAWSLSGATMK